MSVKVIRQPSETPNITNQDDIRMFRYATGGYDGYIPNMLSEFNFDLSSKKIGSGELVCQGWQVQSDSDFDLTSYILNYGAVYIYYTAYAEIVVSSTTETATIKVLSSTSNYPSVSTDDIGGTTTGTMRIALARFISYNGALTSGARTIGSINYQVSKNSNLQQQIDSINFKIKKIAMTNTQLRNTYSSAELESIFRQAYSITTKIGNSVYNCTFRTYGTGTDDKLNYKLWAMDSIETTPIIGYSSFDYAHYFEISGSADIEIRYMTFNS